MTVGELLEVFPKVDTVDFWVRHLDKKYDVRDHTVCGLHSGGGLSSDDAARLVVEVKPFSFTRLDVIVKESK